MRSVHGFQCWELKYLGCLGDHPWKTPVDPRATIDAWSHTGAVVRWCRIMWPNLNSILALESRGIRFELR